MSDEKKPFKVTDRRHFMADGRVRDEEEPQPEAHPGTAGQPEVPRNVPATPAPGQPAGRAPEPASGPLVARSPADPGALLADEPPVDFAGFIVSLAAQAGLLLEGGPTPEGERIPPDLAGARQIIAILEMLKGKTESRRTPEEDRILDGVLYELRMGYLARAGVVGA